MKKALVIGLGRLGEALKNALITNGVETISISSRLEISKLREDHVLDLHGFEYIIWVARDAGLPSNPSNSSKFYYELLEWIAISGWCGNFIFTSSAGEIYGETTDLGARESDILSPSSQYGKLKAKHESMISDLSLKLSFNLLIIRVSNVYQLDLKDSGIVGAVLRSIQFKEIVDLQGGDQTRDFISLDDLVTAVIKLRSIQATGIFNIATGQSISINSLISILENKSSKKVILGKISEVQGINHSQISISKLIGTLKWRPTCFKDYVNKNYLP